MFAALNENKTVYLNTDEYFFLTENLELADTSKFQSGMSYIITNKKKNLQKTVRSVIENELGETERSVIVLYYYDGLSAIEISRACHIARSSVYRNLNSGLKKIENLLKYVLEYDGYSSELSAQELLRYVKEGQIEQ